MAFISNLFNAGQGAGYQAGSAPVLAPVSGEQTKDAYQNVLNALNQQQDYINQLRGQQGVQNQSDVYNQQQALANQLALQTQGGGPNPALAQLQQATGQNVANQAALMAGQRGTNQNVGLLARQAAQQGAGIEQQAAGQAAIQRAQQQLAAQQALQGQQAQMANLASQQVGQLGQAVGGINQYAQNAQQNLLNAAAQQNQANIGMQGNINTTNAGIAQGNQRFQQGVIGGIAGGVGSALGLAEGGEVPHKGYAEGGPISTFGQMLKSSQGSDSSFDAGQNLGQSFVNLFKQKKPEMPSVQGQPNMFDTGVSGNASMGQLGSSDLMMPKQQVAHGGNVGHKLKQGGHVPGKAKVAGDSLKNDTVDAKLSPGEIVIPRSVVHSKDPVKKSAEFVAAVLAKKNMGKR